MARSDDSISEDVEQAAARVNSAVVQALHGARVLVTGGTGFLGSWVVDVLLALNRRHGLGIELALLTRQASTLAVRYPAWAKSPEIGVLEGDVRSFECGDRKFTHVFHGATDPSNAAGQFPLQLAEIIVDGSRHVLQAAAKTGARRYLFFSSGAVTGRLQDPGGLIGEQALTAPPVDDPACAYGNAKRFAEHLHLIAGSELGIDVVIARGFSFVGPRMPLDGHFAMGNFISDAVAGSAPRLDSAGLARRSYLYAADAAVWLITIMASGRAGKIYNVGSDCALSIGELAQRISSLLLDVPPSFPSGGDRTEATSYVPDIALARTELALEPWVSLDDAIVKTAMWARRQCEAR